MIYPATGWFGVVQHNYKQEYTIANLVEKSWICKYQRPTIIIYEHGNEFLGRAFKYDLIKKEYIINPNCETMANPQVNSILEQIHQVIANLVCTFNLQTVYLDDYGPWSGILAATMFAVQITY